MNATAIHLKHAKDIADHFLDEPFSKLIILEHRYHKDGSVEVWTNVPHKVMEHSPTGFEWGFGGSGPADLALNIVETILFRLGWQGERVPCYDGSCYALAYTLHQDFKWQFIATAGMDGAVISYDKARRWVQDRLGKEEQKSNS